MESVHRKKRQQRFSHRRLIVKPQLSFSTPQNHQSTLTQLEFVSTPRSGQAVTDDDDFHEERPSKRIKKNRQHKTNTLTQIGFGDPSGELSEWPNTHVKDSYPDEEITMSSRIEEIVHNTPGRNSPDVQEVVQKSPRSDASDVQEIVQKTPRQDASDIQDIVPASQPSNTETTRCHTASQYSTPRAGRRIEAPSSQTPSSIALSTSHRDRSPVIQQSPLHNRGDSSHKNKVVILSSPIIARDFAVTQPDTEALQALQGRTVSLADAGMNDQDEDDNTQHSEESEDQLNWDPAMSALDRDAARYGMTQYQPTAKIRETQFFLQSSPHEEYDLPESAEKPTQAMSIPDSQPITPIKSVVTPSQVSTISPTQNSKVVEPRAVIESSLPRPPWTESEELEWIEKENAMLARINTLSSEYSLPVPPAFDET